LKVHDWPAGAPDPVKNTKTDIREEVVTAFWPVVGAIGGALVSGLFQQDANEKAADVSTANARESVRRATDAYNANDRTLKAAYDDSGRLLDEGARGGVEQIEKYSDRGYDAWLRNEGYADQGVTAAGRTEGYAEDGRRASDYYNTAVGLDGEQARTGYVQGLMERPEYQAARDKAMRAVQARYGAAGKGGSGAMYRALQRTDAENTSNYIDRDLSRVRPVMQTGIAANDRLFGVGVGANSSIDNQARLADQQIASTKINLGTSLASNSIGLGNALAGNQDQYTTSVVNANSGAAATTANAALMSGAAWGNAFGGLSSALGSYAGQKVS
jgi:hypothetical protein